MALSLPLNTGFGNFLDTTPCVWQIATHYMWGLPLEIALFLLSLSGIAAGVAGAFLRTWSIHSRLYSLEDRTSVVEGIQQREVKIRAAEAKFRRPTAMEESIEAHLTQKAPPKKEPWWKKYQTNVAHKPTG